MSSRVLYDHPNYIRNHDAEKVTQEAIPWCTTHDMKVTIGHKYREWIWDGCIVAVNEWRDNTDTCVVSEGGPDHKWWQDT